MLVRALREIARISRWQRWAGSKLPMLLAAFVVAVLSNEVTLDVAVVGALQLAAHVLGYATFGYVANSFADVREDVRSGKGSVFAGWSAERAAGVVGVAAVAGLVPLFLPPMGRNLALLSGVISVVVAAAYSLRPIRLKERGVFGVLSSALAQRTLPTLTIMLYFGSLTVPLALFVLMSLLVGVRFILVHQADDVISDQITGTRTFATRIGVHRTEELVVRLILPLEAIAVGAWLLVARLETVAVLLLIYLVGHLLMLLLLARRTRFPLAGYAPLSELYASYVPFALALAGVLSGDASLVPVYAGALCLSLATLPASLVEEYHRFRRLLRIGRGRGETLAVSRIRSAARSGVEALEAMQGKDGSFELVMWVRGGEQVLSHHLFASAWVLISAGRHLSQETVQRAAGAVQTARSQNGTWNFDPSRGIPNDADSTSCALLALASSGRPPGEPECSLLRSQWRQERQRFATWFSDDERWRGADRDDPVVNLNILAALQQHASPASDVERSGVARYLATVPPTSRYYCDPMTIPYAAHRVGVPLDLGRHRAWGRPGGRSTTTSIAHWITINDTTDESLVATLLSRQLADGSWPAEPWFTGVNEPYWGSRAVTTAFCVEALRLTEARMQRTS